MYIFIETNFVDKVTIHGGDWGRMEGKLSMLKLTQLHTVTKQFKWVNFSFACDSLTWLGQIFVHKRA